MTRVIVANEEGLGLENFTLQRLRLITTPVPKFAGDLQIAIILN